MKIRIFLLATFICSSIAAYSGNGNDPIGGRSAGMGYASVSLIDFWSLQNNQAGLGYYEHTTAGIYFENRYLVKELSLKSGGFVMPTKSGTFGLSFNSFGYSLYNESKAGLAYAKKLSERFSAGVQLDYIQTAIGEEYGNKGAVTFEVGLMSKVTDQLTVGAHIYNPIQAKLSDYNNERVPANIRFGASYNFSDKALLAAEVSQETSQKASVKAGLEYHVTEPFYVRAGIASDPSLITFGFGLEMKNFNFDFSSSLHSSLGYSPQVSFFWKFN